MKICHKIYETKHISLFYMTDNETSYKIYGKDAHATVRYYSTIRRHT